MRCVKWDPEVEAIAHAEPDRACSCCLLVETKTLTAG
jgi:hypothetical protein